MAHRTALIAAGSIAVVIVAAAVAVGANLGILNAADSRPVGKLSASAAGQSAGPTMVAATAGVASEPSAAPSPVPRKYIIKKAGTVSVTSSKSGLRLTDVSARKGWRWTLAQTSDSKLTVTFKHKKQIYTFVAVLGPHGATVARVDHPITRTRPAAPAVQQVARAAAPAAPRAATTSSPPAHGDGEGGGGEADD